MSTQAPLKPESVIDAAWGMSLFFSCDRHEREYGKRVKDNWEKLCEKQTQPNDIKYFQNIDACMSGTVYNLAMVRQEKSQTFKFLDSLQDKKLKNLDDLAKLSKDAESIFTRFIGLSIGAGISFLSLASSTLGTKEAAIVILGASGFYILFEIFLRLFRYLNSPRIMNDIQDRKQKFIDQYYQPKCREHLENLLKKISSISEEIYGQTSRIEPATINSLATGSATFQSGSHYLSGTIPTDPYYGGSVGYAYYGGALDPRQAGRYLRSNFDRKEKQH